MDEFNVYLTGVGGQGIGLLSDILIRAADRAGLRVISVDTHGLAQRGGIVVSQVRIGESVFSPLISAGRADLVVALERHEALRGLLAVLKDNGTLVYYDTSWQPLEVRLQAAPETRRETLKTACAERGIREIPVCNPNLTNPRMQNIVILGMLNRYRLIPGLDKSHYEEAMKGLMSGRMLTENLKLFQEIPP